MKQLLIQHEPSPKELYVKKQKAIEEAIRKIDIEYSKDSKPTDGMYFDEDKMFCMIQTILTGGSTKNAYKRVQEDFNVSKGFTSKASKRHSVRAFEQALKQLKNTATAQLLTTYKMFGQGYKKLYYQEVVSTGLTRLARNVHLVTQLEELLCTKKALIKENKDLSQKVYELESKMSIEGVNWFEDIAVPMRLEGATIAEIAKRSGQKPNTVSKRFRREQKDTVPL